MCSNDDYHPGCRSAICLAVIVLLGVSPVVAQEASEKEVKSAVSSGMPTEAVLDIRDEKVPFKVQKGDFVAVPIPMSIRPWAPGSWAARRISIRKPKNIKLAC